MPTGAASRHAGFPSLVPNPLTGRGEGLPSRRGAPPSSLPTTSSSCTSPAGREGSQGSARCSGPQDLHPERAGCRQASPFPSCRWAPAQPGAHGPSRPTALFPMAYKGELSFHYFLFPFKRLKKKKIRREGERTETRATNTPPNFLQSPKPKEPCPPNRSGEGLLPTATPGAAAQTPHRRATAAEARAQNCRRASEIPCRPGGGTGSSSPPGVSPFPPQPLPAAPAVGSVTGHRSVAAPGRSRAHFVPRQKPARAPASSSVRSASLARGPPDPAAEPKPALLAQSRGATALPRGPGFTLQLSLIHI